MKTARRKPTTRAAATKSTPKIAACSIETVQRSVEKSRWYWASPTQSKRGTILELLTEMRADHTTVHR
jgi:hypothetical protein